MIAVRFGCFAISGSSDVRWWLALAGAKEYPRLWSRIGAQGMDDDPVVVVAMDDGDCWISF